jgi:hypothetical protein
LRYSQLLAELPSGLEVIIPVICGNDFYTKGRICVFDEVWSVDAAELCDLAVKKASRCFPVVGGSAATWKYDERLPVDQCLLFDAHVQRLREVLEGKNIQFISGANELQGLELGDKMGHYSSASEHIVFDACVSWVTQCHGILPGVLPVAESPGLDVFPSVPEISPVSISVPVDDLLSVTCVLEEPVQVSANILMEKDKARG